jgi:hypothetical protein
VDSSGGCGDELAGRPLPTKAGTEPSEERRLYGAYSDRYALTGAGGAERPGKASIPKAYMRRGCDESDNVFGAMASVIDYPFKLHWYENSAPELFDLSWDPLERSDLAEYQPERVDRMKREVEIFVEAADLLAEVSELGEGPSPAELRALRSLGYIE